MSHTPRGGGNNDQNTDKEKQGLLVEAGQRRAIEGRTDEESQVETRRRVK